VIGGGNVAFDVARTARRLGGDVSIVCLENEDKASRDGIPADVEEIEGAREEGISINYSRGVEEIVGRNGRFTQIKCPRCTSVFDASGFNPRCDRSDAIYLAGFSGGGMAAFVTAHFDPGRFAGVISNSGALHENLESPTALKATDLKRIVFLAGTKDQVVPEAHLKGNAALVESAGIPLRFFSFEKLLYQYSFPRCSKFTVKTNVNSFSNFLIVFLQSVI